uniref:ARID domain-containing protein n=1 Tax=Periophthalmus magnuspinnatus TaxID=409849 RepID=A0A3B4AHG8_9GOBI
VCLIHSVWAGQAQEQDPTDPHRQEREVREVLKVELEERREEELSEEGRAEEQAFLVELYKYMKERDTPIERIPFLGFKQINLWTMFQAAQKLGGYELITVRRQWKHVYDELGGNPSSTSAATCTRRHYERLLLPYERHIKGEQDKPLPLTKPRKQEGGAEKVPGAKLKGLGTKKPKNPNNPKQAIKKERGDATAGPEQSQVSHTDKESAAYKAGQGVMSPLAKKKLLSQVCESNTFAFSLQPLAPPPSAYSALSLSDRDTKQRNEDSGQRPSSDGLSEVPIFRPSVIQHAQNFSISKQRLSSVSKSFCALSYPIMHQSLESHPKACKVTPMTVSPSKQTPDTQTSFPSPKTSSESSPNRPSKRSVAEAESEDAPQRKVRVVTPIHPTAAARRSDPEELKAAEPAHAVHLNNHIPEGHPATAYPHAALYSGLYAPSLVSATAQDGLQQHPGLQYLKSQSAVSPLVPPLAFHSMMLHRQLLAASPSAHAYYRHPGGAALYGDLLHHLYPLSTLPPPQLSSVHPSTRL